MKILVLDDDDDGRRAMITLLRRNGYNCFAAYCVKEAAYALACHGPFDFALLDWNLGAGQTAEPIRDKCREVKIRTAIVSGSVDLKEIAADAHFAKPLEFSELLKWLNQGSTCPTS